MTISNTHQGTVIHNSLTKCYLTDNLKKFASRHYKNEVNLLINFEKYLMRGKIMKLKKNPPTMRMPIQIEKSLINHFKKSWKQKFLND